MKVRLAQPRLESLDELHGRCLVLTCFADDRPLRGLTGLVDWRLNGRLSRLVLREFVDGHYREATLTPSTSRLTFDRVLLIGMGKRSEFNADRFEETCRFCFDTLVRMEVLDFAMSLPGRVGLDVGLRQALAGWRRALSESFAPEHVAELQVTILETPEVQRELVEPMRLLERELTEIADRHAAEQARRRAEAEAQALADQPQEYQPPPVRY